MKKFLVSTSIVILMGACHSHEVNKPNLIFILMDDLGYGHVSFHNDTLTTRDLDPDFIRTMLNQPDDSEKYVDHHPNNRIELYSPDSAIALSRRAMPTLQSIAESSVIFGNAYACNSLCAPSRLGIATGLHPVRMGVYENADVEKNGPGKAKHLAEKLKEQGYALAHIGKWHIGARNDDLLKSILSKYDIDGLPGKYQLRKKYPEAYKEVENSGYFGSILDEHHPLNNGFDYYFGYNNWASQFYNSTLVWENFRHAGPQKNYNTDVFTDTAVSFITKQLELKQPFYLQLHYHAVHDSLKPKAPDTYFNKFNTGSYDLNNFYAHLNAVDSGIKKIITLLESKKALENTIIVFSSDNGASSGGPSVLPGNAPFAGHKGTYFCGGVRVPLLFFWPEKIQKGTRSDLMVSNMDILPTLIEAAGGNVPDTLDGKSLYDIITGKSSEPVHEYLCWAGMHSMYFGFLIERSLRQDLRDSPPAYAVMKDGYLLRYIGKTVPDLYADCPEGCESTTQLYNITKDPAERDDLYSIMPEAVNDLGNIYIEWKKVLVPPVRWSRSKYEELIIPENSDQGLEMH
jgi:uncharacterized sulfatase